MASYNRARHIGDIIKEKNIVLRGADAASRSGFTQVPNFILTTPTLTTGAKLAYATLLSYAWHNDYCFPGQDRLAVDIGVSRQSTNTYIRELERKGFLQITRRGQGKPNIYQLSLTARGKR